MSRLTNEPAADVVDRQLEAYNRHDVEAFVACFTEDARFVVLPGRVDLEGRDAFRIAYGRLFTERPAIRARIAQRIVVGRFVTDLELLEGLSDEPGPPVMVIYETVGDLIRTVWVAKVSS